MHAFPIRFDFIRVISVYAVPVLRRNNRHGRDHKVFVNGIKCGAGALLNMLYDLADYYQLQNYLCVKEGETNFAYCFVYSLEDGRRIRI